MFACLATDDFFRARLDHMIDLRQPLVVLASHMPWQALEARVAQTFSRRASAGKPLPDLDLFGEQAHRVARQSNAGRPRVPLRTMIALLYLKHAFNLSDEALVERWSDSPNFQYFSGQAHFEPRLPCDATTLVKFRRLLGEEGCEELLAQTINQAVSMKLIPAAALATVVVDSTVQEKAIAHPNDARLLEVARHKLVQVARDSGVDLKQSFAKEGKALRFKAGRYAHALLPAA
jgi:IS5 family transposase